jgi:hypothetical protein
METGQKMGTNEGDATLRTLGTKSGVVVAIDIGIEHFRTGLIQLRIHADGGAHVTQLRAGKSATWDAHWTTERVREIGVTLADSGLCAIAARAGQREPGDVPVRLRLLDGERTVCGQDVWHGDRYVDAALDRIIKTFDALVGEVSGGVLPF